MSINAVVNNRFENLPSETIPENIHSSHEKKRNSKIQKRLQRAASVTTEQFKTLDGIKTLSQVADTSAKISEVFQGSTEIGKNIRSVASELQSSISVIQAPLSLVNYGQNAYQAIPLMFGSQSSLNDRIGGIDTLFFGATSLIPMINSVLKFLGSDKHKFVAIPLKILKTFSFLSAICMGINAVKNFFNNVRSIAKNECMITDSPKKNKKIYRILTFQVCSLLRTICMLATSAMLLASSFGVVFALKVSLPITVISLSLLIGLKYYQGMVDPGKKYLNQT